MNTTTQTLANQAAADVTRTCATFPSSQWFLQWATTRGVADQAVAIEAAVKFDLTGIR